MEQNMVGVAPPELSGEERAERFRQIGLYTDSEQPPHVPHFDRDEAYQERMARRRKIADKVRELQAPEIARLEQRRQTEKNRRNAVQASRKKNRRNKR